MLIDQRPPAVHRAGIVSDQELDLVLRLFDLLARRRDACCCGFDELLGLAQIEQGSDTADLPLLRQLEEILAVFQGCFGDFQFVVKFAELKIIGRELADQRADNGFASLFRVQEVAAPPKLRAPTS